MNLGDLRLLTKECPRPKTILGFDADPRIPLLKDFLKTKATEADTTDLSYASFIAFAKTKRSDAARLFNDTYFKSDLDSLSAFKLFAMGDELADARAHLTEEQIETLRAQNLQSSAAAAPQPAPPTEAVPTATHETKLTLTKEQLKTRQLLSSEAVEEQKRRERRREMTAEEAHFIGTGTGTKTGIVIGAGLRSRMRASADKTTAATGSWVRVEGGAATGTKDTTWVRIEKKAGAGAGSVDGGVAVVAGCGDGVAGASGVSSGSKTEAIPGAAAFATPQTSTATATRPLPPTPMPVILVAAQPPTTKAASASIHERIIAGERPIFGPDALPLEQTALLYAVHATSSGITRAVQAYNGTPLDRTTLSAIKETETVISVYRQCVSDLYQVLNRSASSELLVKNMSKQAHILLEIANPPERRGIIGSAAALFDDSKLRQFRAAVKILHSVLADKYIPLASCMVKKVYLAKTQEQLNQAKTEALSILNAGVSPDNPTYDTLLLMINGPDSSIWGNIFEYAHSKINSLNMTTAGTVISRAGAGSASSELTSAFSC